MYTFVIIFFSLTLVVVVVDICFFVVHVTRHIGSMFELTSHMISNERKKNAIFVSLFLCRSFISYSIQWIASHLHFVYTYAFIRQSWPARSRTTNGSIIYEN